MSNTDKEIFTELSVAEASMIQGGYKFTGYDYGGHGTVAQADRGIPNLKYPNTIEQVYITEGKWQLYDSDNYKNPIGDPIGPTNGQWFVLPGNLRDRANSVLKVG
jgi:hypothetical protein